jgi:DNA-binding response OmpR family regulator
VPVVVTTARLDDAISSGYVLAGADDMLFKPFTLDEIIDKAEWYMSETEA